MNLIATFYSHFGAVRFLQQCKVLGLEAKLTPVPRNLSSSCGTCARYALQTFCPIEPVPEEIEQIVEVLENDYRVLYRAENS